MATHGEPDGPSGLRIGYFTGIYPRATDTFIQREVHGLRARGFDVLTFSVRMSGPDHDVSPEILSEKQNTFYVLPFNPIRVAMLNLRALATMPLRYWKTMRLAWRTARVGARGLLFQLFYFQEALLMAAQLQRHRIQHLHNHLGDASGTVTLLASKLADIGYSITFHGPHIFFDPANWALREKVKHSRFIVCISHYCRSQIMLYSDREDWGRLSIVHCGVNLAHYEFRLARPHVKKLLYTGRLAAEKGIPVLFESLSMLCAQGYDFELTLVGDGPDRKVLMTLAQELGIANKTTFAGFANQDKVRDYLCASDVFILPSFAEGVPVSLMEAMACGIPVIATYVGGVTELVEDGRTGQVVYAGDPKSLQSAISRYLNDRALRECVSRNGRDRVAAQFDLDREIGKLASLFTQHVRGPVN